MRPSTPGTSSSSGNTGRLPSHTGKRPRPTSFHYPTQPSLKHAKHYPSVTDLSIPTFSAPTTRALVTNSFTNITENRELHGQLKAQVTQFTNSLGSPTTPIQLQSSVSYQYQSRGKTLTDTTQKSYTFSTHSHKNWAQEFMETGGATRWAPRPSKEQTGALRPLEPPKSISFPQHLTNLSRGIKALSPHTPRTYQPKPMEMGKSSKAKAESGAKQSMLMPMLSYNEGATGKLAGGLQHAGDALRATIFTAQMQTKSGDPNAPNNEQALYQRLLKAAPQIAENGAKDLSTGKADITASHNAHTTAIQGAYTAAGQRFDTKLKQSQTSSVTGKSWQSGGANYGLTNDKIAGARNQYIANKMKKYNIPFVKPSS